MPAAGTALPRLTAERSGLGLSLDEVEAAAEAMLADQAGLDFDDLAAHRGELPKGAPAFPPGASPREPAGVAAGAGGCRRGEAPCHPGRADPGGGRLLVLPAPARARPLAPPPAQ